MKQIDPASRDPLMPQIAQAIKARNFQSALTLCRKLASRLSAERGRTGFARGMLAAAVKEYPQAEEALRRAVALAPNSAFAHSWLGKCGSDAWAV